MGHLPLLFHSGYVPGLLTTSHSTEVSVKQSCSLEPGHLRLEPGPPLSKRRASVCLSLFLSQMGMIMVLPSELVWGLNELIYLIRKRLGSKFEHRKYSILANRKKNIIKSNFYVVPAKPRYSTNLTVTASLHITMVRLLMNTSSLQHWPNIENRNKMWATDAIHICNFAFSSSHIFKK